MPGKTHKETAKHQQAFLTWYGADRDFPKVAETWSVSESTARNWGDWFGWKARADRLDREAAAKADRDAIRRRAQMLIRHRQAAELMQLRGMERLKGNKIGSDRDALSAIKEGVALERQVEGLPDYVALVLNADEDGLRSILAELDRADAVESAGDAAVAGVHVPATVSNGNGKH